MFEGGDEDLSTSFMNMNMVSKKKKKTKTARRFSNEQIQSLETIFEVETKLEPRKKIQLAKELGLQPRQVAIWFQNKRARWKSKKLERDYSILLDEYKSLVTQFESLKKEKQSLVIQLKKLNEMVEKSEMEIKSHEQVVSSENGENIKNDEYEVLSPRLCLDGSENDSKCLKAADYIFGLEEDSTELMNIMESTDSSLASHEDLLNQTADSSDQWWDFWS